MQKLSLRDKIKEARINAGESFKGGKLWSSIFRPGSPFRKGYVDSPRNRSYVVMNNVLYHLHPVKVKRHGVRLSYTLCLGGLSFFLFIVLTITGIWLMFYFRPTELAYVDIQNLQTSIAFGASQLLLLGLVLIVWNDKQLTWAKATYFAFLTWIEMSILLGIVPSEWLNLSQGPLEWTGQREFIQFPPILFLNNEIGLSFAALKDLIQLGISTNFLIAGLVVAYQIQDINDKVEKSKSRISDYGKEVVRVEQDA